LLPFPLDLHNIISSIDYRQTTPFVTFARITARKCGNNRFFANIGSDTGKRWHMTDHIGIGGIRQGAMTLASFDASA
jgi:hypothetical protein